MWLPLSLLAAFPHTSRLELICGNSAAYSAPGGGVRHVYLPAEACEGSLFDTVSDLENGATVNRTTEAVQLIGEIMRPERAAAI